MPVSLPVVSEPTSRRADMMAQHGAKLMRYCGVSGINVLIGQTTLLIALGLGMVAVVANITSWVLSTGPAYFMSRKWVWKRTPGAHGFGDEILPFWMLALAGLGFSSFVVWIVGGQTESNLVIAGASLAAYGVVWVAKYVVIDRLLWNDSLELVPAVVESPT